MSKKRGRISRREFVKLAGTGALAAGADRHSFRYAQANKGAKILVEPLCSAYDTWFNGTFTKEWGKRTTPTS
jgi:hypothetical protein